MSRIRQPEGDDFPDAARKNLLDAGSLLHADRPDGAAYLSGYVVECALKTLLFVETGQKPPMSHDVAQLRFAAAWVSGVAGAKTAKYFGHRTRGVGHPGSSIGAWDPVMRYRTESMALQDAGGWYEEANSVYGETLYQMFLDGVV